MSDELNDRWQQLEPWLSLFHIPGLGGTRYRALLEAFGDPVSVLSAGIPELRTVVPDRLACAIKVCRRNPTVVAALSKDKEWFEQAVDHHILSLGDPRYPALLKTIYDPPPLLYIKGDAEALNRQQLAVVGSRKPTLSGQNNAHDLSRDIASAGLTITSGLARGIDGAAHQGALNAGGKTIAVLACGVDIVYPVRHKVLADRIQAQGALVSEFPLGTQPKAGHFPRRNRIISGLSFGVLVVEAAVASGSLVTAKCALDQGREVFAIPGAVNNPVARGCHALIREGACLVENAEQILEEINGVMVNHSLSLNSRSQEQETLPECPEQQQILSLLGSEACHQDELIAQTGMDGRKISELLFQLELDGFVKSVPGGIARAF